MSMKKKESHFLSAAMIVFCIWNAISLSSCLAQSADLIERSDRLARLKTIVLENEWEDWDYLDELRGLLNVVLDSKDLEAANFIQDWLQSCETPKNAGPDFFKKYLLVAFVHSRFRSLPDPISLKVAATNDGIGTKLQLPKIVVEIVNSDQFGRPIQIDLGGGEFRDSGETRRITMSGEQFGAPIKKRPGKKGEIGGGGFLTHVTLLPNESLKYTLWLRDYIETPALGQMSIDVTYRPFFNPFNDSGKFADVHAKSLNIDIVDSEQAMLKSEYTELLDLVRQLSSSRPIAYVKGEFDQTAKNMLPVDSVASQILSYGDSAFPVLLARLRESENEFERGWILSILSTLAQANDPTLENEKNLLGNYISYKPIRVLNVDGPDRQGLTRTYPGGTAYFWFGKFFHSDPREALKDDRIESAMILPETAKIIAATPTDYKEERRPDIQQQIEFSKLWDSWNDAVEVEFDGSPFKKDP